MFRFEQIEYLYLLGLIPIFLGLYYVGILMTQRKLGKFGNLDLISRLIPDLSKIKQHIKFIFMLLAFLLLCISWANPQWGHKKAKAKAKSTDIFLAIDISQSMMAEDISPNRLERAKRFTTRLLKKLKSERVGLIFFAGNAYLQVPVTHDIASVELFVKSANTEQAGTQGTAIAQAIALCEESLELDDDENYKKALVILTDGENHEQEVIEAAKAARKKGIIIYTVGVGTEEGAYVQVLNRGFKEVKKDASGNPIKTSLNVQMIKDLAEAGGGLSYLINNQDEVISSIVDDISKLEKKESELQSFSEYNSYFQYFLFVAIILLLIEFLMSNIKNNKTPIEQFFGKNA